MSAEVTRRWLERLFLSLVVWAVVAISEPARADDLADAKSAGHVGERIDGYLGIVVAAPPSHVPPLVDQINGERQASYAEIAQNQGVEVGVVAQIAGEKLIERAAPGEWVLGADGVWRQK